VGVPELGGGLGKRQALAKLLDDRVHFIERSPGGERLLNAEGLVARLVLKEVNDRILPGRQMGEVVFDSPSVLIVNGRHLGLGKTREVGIEGIPGLVDLGEELGLCGVAWIGHDELREQYGTPNCGWKLV
jgi:hypothetical protein